MLKNIFFIGFIIFFFLLFVFLGAIAIRSQQKNISLKEALRSDSRNIILEIKDIIYFEATKHNPQGDVLPDNLDDAIKNEIKKRI